MKIRITIARHSKRTTTLIIPVDDQYKDLETFSQLCRSLWKVEQTLNGIKGANLVVSFHVEQGA